MKTKNAVTILQTFAEIYPDSELTFANNKVPVNLIVYDEKTNTVNLR